MIDAAESARGGSGSGSGINKRGGGTHVGKVYRVSYLHYGGAVVRVVVCGLE